MPAPVQETSRRVDGPGSPSRLAEDGAVTSWWLDRAVVALAGCVLCIGTVGLILSMAGAFSTWIALLVGLLIAGLLAWNLRRIFPVEPVGRAQLVGALVAIAIAVVSMLWSSFAPSHHVLIDRDPGSYVSTAKWIERSGSLQVDDATGPFAGFDGVSFGSSAVIDVGDGRLQFQFNHFVSSTLAVVDGVVGSVGLFRLMALVGALSLLAVYSVTVRVTARPLVSLLAPATLGLSMPFISVTREVYSEPVALLFLWCGLLLADQMFRRPQVLTGLLGGVFVGATVMVRIDSVIYLSLLVALVAGLAVISRHRGLPGWERVVGACLAGAVLAAAVGTIDIVAFSKGYYALVRVMVLPLWGLVLVAAVLGCLVVLLAPRLRSAAAGLDRRRAAFGAAVAIVVFVGMLLAWWVRPHVMVGRRSEPFWGLIGNLQAAEGQEVDIHRSYAESTVMWMSWYLGIPAMALGVAGFALMVYRTLTSRVSAALVMVTLLLGTVGALYFWNPRITPDHIWAMRRFVPAVLPSLIVAATLGVAWVAERRPGRFVTRVGVGALAVVMLAGAAAPTLRVPLQRQQHGYDRVIEQACALVGDGPVLVVGRPSITNLPQTLRSWCGVDAAAAPPEFSDDAAFIERLAEHFESQGADLVVISSDPQALLATESLPGARSSATASVTATRRLEHTLTRVPDRYLENHEAFDLPADLQLNVVRLVR